MESLIEKLSRYHILNNLIPGIIFICLLNILNIFVIDMDSITQLLFIGYFSGMTLSRIGSVIIEPFLKKINIIRYADYKDYLEAESIDPKISNLLEDNNMFRTFVALFLVLVILAVGNSIRVIKIFYNSNYAIILLLVSLFVLYLCAYKKQTSYIRRRVNKANGKLID